jgi:peptidoglycan hydrolase CwlO-like protein
MKLIILLFFKSVQEMDMTRIKEPSIGTTNLPNYKSPPSRIMRSLRKGYDNVRAKVADKSQAIQDLQGKLRDTQVSRENWKARTTAAEAKVAELQEENNKLNERLKKKRLK